MTENVTPLPEKSFDPKYALSEPTIEDTVRLASALLRNADRQTVELLASDKAEKGVYDLFLGAVGNPAAFNDILLVFSGLWKLSVDVEEPHEDWDYEPAVSEVERGQKLSREEMWRTISRANRRQMVKRIELGKLSYRAWGEFYKAFRATVDLSDFLGSVQGFVKARSGDSTTDSPNGTAGPTEG